MRKRLDNHPRSEGGSTPGRGILLLLRTLIGHRYLVGHPLQAGNPILSVYQSDIIFYGSNIRAFLLLELADLLVNQPADDNQDVPPDPSSIPFWGEIMQLH